MSFNLNPRSMRNLTGVHPDLARVVKLAAQRMDDSMEFIVTEGVRTVTRQAELVKAGASRTMKSRHLTGHAVDLAPLIGGEVRWDWPPFYRIADAMKAAAKDLIVPITWGGEWVSFRDGPHWELPRETYP